MSDLSFSNDADQKGWLKDKLLPVVNTVLQAGCKIGTVVAPTHTVTAGVCAASKVSGVVNGLVNK